MAVGINFNICDNSPECSGISVCDFGAIYWDENQKNVRGEAGTICIDNNKCVSCGKCVGEDGCPVGAIIFAESLEKLSKIIKDIQLDEGKIKALFVERYGAEPINDEICCSLEELTEIIKEKDEYILIEEFCDNSIQCLLSSIPVEDILREFRKILKIEDIAYYKCDVTDQKCDECDYPTLKLIRCNTGQTLLKIDGYYDNRHKADLFQIISNKLSDF